ncbi:MAG: cytochrome c biogenesis protein ResB [Candidatus Schekmanbacteria bacterium]|nr:cytochrome c biogenesis protein ResB [Candidatus Schekmanbacteria bacterium]
MKKIWQFFCSLNLTVYLGLALCVLLLIGSFCFMLSGENLAGLNSEVLFPWLIKCGWAGLTYTWWLWLTLIVIALMGINTFVCSIDRLSVLVPKVLRPKLDVTRQYLSGLALSQEMLLSAPVPEIQHLLQKALPFSGFKKFQQKQQADGSLVIFAQKGRWAVFGPYIAHLGFLLVLTGHLIGSIFGYKDFGAPVTHEEKYFIADSSLWIRLLGMNPCVKGDKTSGDCGTINIGENNTFLQKFMFGPNQPLFYRGFAIYQGDWERRLKAVNLTVKHKDGQENLLIRMGERKNLNPQLSLMPYLILPDFAFSPEGRPSSLSEKFDNPALYLLVFQNGAPVKQGWLFLHNYKLQSLYYNDWEIKFSGLSTYTVLYVNIARNPGAYLVLTGGIIFILGSAWFLLGNHRRVWFYLQPQEDKTLLILAGLAGQRRTKLRAQMEHIGERLKRHYR